jgi:hypothetical protein
VLLNLCQGLSHLCVCGGQRKECARKVLEQLITAPKRRQGHSHFEVAPNDFMVAEAQPVPQGSTCE